MTTISDGQTSARGLRILFLTCFGVGYLRPAPGTWGSLPPVALLLGLIALLGRGEWTAYSVFWLNFTLLVVALLFTLVCIGAGRHGEECFGCKDPSPIVADEVAGQSIALLFLPWHPDQWKWNLGVAAAAFFAFRLMDILKPPPAHALQRLAHGMGIVIDDLLAGAYALVMTQIAVRLVWPAVWA